MEFTSSEAEGMDSSLFFATQSLDAVKKDSIGFEIYSIMPLLSM